MEHRSALLKPQWFVFHAQPRRQKDIWFVTVWGAGSSSPGAQEVWSPSYICAARHFLSFLPPPPPIFWLFC